MATLTLGTIFKGEAAQLINEIGRVKTALKDIVAQFNTINAGASKLSAAFQSVQSASSKGAKALTEYDKALDRIGKSGTKLNALNAITKGIEKNSKVFPLAAKAIHQVDVALGRLSADYKNYLVQTKGIAAGTKEFNKELGRLRPSLTTGQRGSILAAASFDRFRGALDNSKEALAGWLSKQTKATQNFKDFAKSVNLPLTGMQRLEKAYKSGSIGIREYTNAVNKVKAAQEKAAKIRSEVLGQQEKLTQATKAASKATSTHSNLLGSLYQRVKNLAEYATASTAVYGFVNAIRSGVTEIIEFSQALKNLEAITLTENFGEILAAAEEIKKIAQTTKFSVTELGGGMVVLAQTGYDAVQSLEIINSVGKLAAATLSSLSTVTDLLTSTMRAFSKEAHEAGVVSDIMANAINLSKLTIDKLRIAFNYIGVAAKQAGIELRETVTIFALLANSGLRASTMATGLRQVLSKLINPTQKVRAALEGYGVAIDELNPKIQQGLRPVLLNLTSLLWDHQRGAVDMVKAYKLFQLRGAQAAAAIAAAFKSGDYDQMLEKMSRLGTSSKMASIQLEGLGAKLKRLADTAKLVIVTLGDAGLTPVLHAAVDGLKALADGLKAFLETGIGKITVQTALLVAGIKAMTTAFVLIKSVIAPLITTLTVLIARITTVYNISGAAAAATFTFRKAIVALGGPISATLVALGGIVLTLKHFAETSKKAAEEAAKTSIQITRQADALKNTSQLLEALWGKGKVSDYSDVIRQLASEYPKLAKRVAELGGVADITSLSFEKLMSAMQKATSEFTWKGIEEGIESLKKYKKAVSEAQYWKEQQAPWADYFTGFKKAATESVEAYKVSLNSLVKMFTRLKIEGRISGAEINKKLQEMGIVGDDAVVIMNKLRQELKSAAAAAAGIELRRFETSFQKLSIQYKDLYNHLDASRKAEFIKFQASIDAKIAMIRKYGKDYAFSEEETNQAIAALRAREMADWMLANNERLEGKKDSEEAAIGVVETFLQKTVQLYRKGSIDRQRAEGEFVGYTEVINRKYLDGIKRVYGEVTKIVGNHLSNLRSQLDETLAGIDRVTSEIVDANKSYYDDIRDLQQKTMTDEQRWLDDRKEANRLLNEGINTQNADTLKEAQALFKSLARDVTGDSGETVKNIEETAKAAQAGVGASHKALVEVLEGQKNQFKRNIDIIRDEIKKAEDYLSHYKKKIEEVSSEPFRLNTSELKTTFNTLAADLESFKKQISEKPVEFNVVFTGEGSDKKLITEKIVEVKEEVDKAAVEINKKEATVTVDFKTEFGQEAEEAARELPGKISAAIVTTPVTIPLTVESDPGVFELGVAKVKEFAVTSAEAAKKVTNAFSYMRDKVFSASNIFKVVFFGDDAELGGGDSLIDKTKQVIGTLKNASENISSLRTTFTTILQSGDGVDLSKKARSIVDSFKASSETINALKTSFVTMFRTDDGVPLKQAFLNTMQNALDLSLNIKSMNTNFELMFEDQDGMPLSDRIYEIASQSADLSDFISGLTATFKTDFLTNEGLSITSQFDRTAKAANTLANLVNDMTSVFMVNFQGKGSTERPITEKIREVTGQIKNFASRISQSTANFITNFINDEGISFSKIGGWIKDKLDPITKYINDSDSAFITAFKTDEGFSLGKMINWIIEKFGFVSDFINNLKSIFSISFLSDDGLTFKDKMALLKDKIKLMVAFIGETAATFKTKFTDESGKFSLSVMVESIRNEILKLWTFINEKTAQFTTEFITGDGAPLRSAFDWLSEKFIWLKDLITGLTSSFMTGFEDTEGKPVMGTITTIANMITNLVKIIKKSVTKFVTNFTDGEGNPLSKAFTGAEDLAKDTSSSIRGMSTLFKVFVSDKEGMPLRDKLKATVGSVQKVKDTINGMKTGLRIAVTADKMGLPVPDKMKGIVGIIRKTSDTINKVKTWVKVKFTGDDESPVKQNVDEITKKIEGLADAGVQASKKLSKEIESEKPKYDIQFVSGPKSASEMYKEMTDSTADLRTRISAGLSLFRIGFTGSDGSEGMESTSVKDQVKLLKENLEFLSKYIERTKTGYKIVFGTGENKSVSERIEETLKKIKTSARLINNINAFYRVGLTAEDEKGNPLADLSDTVKKVSDVAVAIGNTSADFKTFITDGKGKPLGDALKSTVKLSENAAEIIRDHSPEFAVNFVTGRGKSLSERWKDVRRAGKKVSDEYNKLKTQFKIDFLSDEKVPLTDAILNTGYRLRRLAEEITGNFRAKMTFLFVGDKGKDVLSYMNKVHDKVQDFWTGVQKTWFKNAKKLVIKVLGEDNKPLADSLTAALDMVQIWGETMNKRGHGFIRWLMLGKDLKEGPLSETLISTKNLVDSTMDYISEKKAKLTVWFTGKGSSERPLTEKIDEVDDKVKNFSDSVEDANPKLVTAFEGAGGKPISEEFNWLVESFHNVGSRISYAWNEWSTRVVNNVDILSRSIRVLTLRSLTKLSGVIGPVTTSFKGFGAILKGVYNMASPVMKVFARFGPMFLKVAGAFNAVSAALATFLTGWDMGRIVTDMDLFGLLPMKVKYYVEKTIGFLDSLLEFAKGVFLILGKNLAEKLGFKSIAEEADAALSKVRKDMDKIKGTVDDIQPVKVKVEDDGAVSGAVKIKRQLTNILGEAGSETINYYKTVFTGKINPEGPLPEIAGKAKNIIYDYLSDIERTSPEVITEFKGKVDNEVLNVGQATVKVIKKYAEASAEIAKAAQSKSAVFVAKFDVKTTGPMDSPERMTQSMYNTWSDFYNKLDGLRKISFEKFWQDTQNQVTSYNSATKNLKMSEEERAVDIQRIREEAFAKFRATAEKEMNAVRTTSLISVVEAIGKKTAEIATESSERIAAYEDEIRNLERLQIEADTIYQKSQAQEPAAPTWDSLNQSVGILSDLSEKEIGILRAAHQQKVALYQSSLTSEQALQKGKEAFNDALNQSVGEYVSFSQAEIDAIKKSNEERAKLFDEGSKLYEKPYDLEAAKTSADKIRDIQLKIARERVEAVRKSLNMSIALLDDHTQREVATVKKGLAEKHKYDKENIESAKKTGTAILNAQVERLTKSEKLELEYQVDRAKFWGMNVEKMKGQESALVGIMEASVNARKRLDEDAALSSEKTNAKIVDSRKKALTDEQKIDLQYHIDRAKFWGMNVELAKTKHVDLTRVLENAVNARKKLEQDAALESVQVEQNKAQVISQVSAESTAKKQAATKQELEAERIVAKETETINRGVYKKKKEFYEKARDALKQSLEEARNIEKSIAQEIQSVYEAMAESQKSTEEKIRDIRRGRMTEEQAYHDQWKEVEEIIAKADEMDASRMEEKIALYKKAQDKVAGLNKEVKAGEQVVVDKGAASIKVENKLIEVEKKIQEGYKTRAKILEEQQKQAQKDIKATKATLEEMNKTITAITAETKKIEIELNEPEVSAAISRIQAEINGIEGKTVKIKVEKEEGYATGGRVGFATGGRVWGAGHPPGIDTVPANLTIEEFVQPVSATRKFGFGFMEFIRQRIPPVENIRLLMAAGTRKIKDVLKSGVQKFNSGGPVMAKAFSDFSPVITINPTMPGLDFKGINNSIIQNYAVGGQVSSMPDLQNFGTFNIVGPGGIRIENAMAQKSALEMLKEEIANESKRRVNAN